MFSLDKCLFEHLLCAKPHADHHRSVRGRKTFWHLCPEGSDLSSACAKFLSSMNYAGSVIQEVILRITGGKYVEFGILMAHGKY